jgi:1,4-alpha-glucan branching enzyme
MRKPVGQLVFALHTHLPFVLNHGRWPHGSEWLSEVTVACYLPLLRTLEGLAADGVGPIVTMNISPILCEQLASAAFREEIAAYLDQRLQICDDTQRYFAATHDDAVAALCGYWRERYEEARRQFDTIDGDLLGGFRRLADRGTVELISTAATHGYFPLLGRDESLDLQLRVAAASHARHFGSAPKGVWLPECAYRPRYEWTPPVGPRAGKVRYRRRGVEELLSAHRLEYFFTDVHLVRGGRALSAYGDYFPRLRSVAGPEGSFFRREEWSPYEIYRVASRGGTGDVNAFVRDPETTLQVWSRDSGYPGDEWYLEFHKRHFPGGLRFWRVTHPKSDLADKQVYVPERAAERARAHAAHFAGVVRAVLARYTENTGRSGVLCSPFDTELFGHWWAEGAAWLGHVFRELRSEGVGVTTGSACAAQHEADGPITLLEGSWGEGGDHRVWLNKDTTWTWETIYPAEDTLWGLVSETPWQRTPLLRRIVAQLGRELLLMEASDWQFLISTWAARNYAETRFAEHHTDFERLVEFARRVQGGGALSAEDHSYLTDKEAQDFCFPDIAEHLEAAAGLPKL